MTRRVYEIRLERDDAGNIHITDTTDEKTILLRFKTPDLNGEKFRDILRNLAEGDVIIVGIERCPACKRYLD